jgi:hypothetical protein
MDKKWEKSSFLQNSGKKSNQRLFRKKNNSRNALDDFQLFYFKENK